tara:strand:- start:1490 stop:2212 length:723 start_codon:yes stop_codon:yes gene_type:complete
MVNHFKGIKALTFDVFGTVVDWRGSIIAECKSWEKTRLLNVNWEKFADEWRSEYGPSMNLVRNGEIPWTKLDDLHMSSLIKLLKRHKITNLSSTEIEYLNKIWHRLNPWPDTLIGLSKLKTKFTIATLSNGNVSLLTNMAKWGNLPWDCILSAELSEHYKKDPEAYLKAAELLSLERHEIMMVAAHKDDLSAANHLGMKTCFVPRPLEHGANKKIDSSPENWIDICASDFIDLASQLGCH